jgi:hypothetical protein
MMSERVTLERAEYSNASAKIVLSPEQRIASISVDTDGSRQISPGVQSARLEEFSDKQLPTVKTDGAGFTFSTAGPDGQSNHESEKPGESHGHFWQTTSSVLGDYAAGIYQEAKNHPSNLIKNAAIGAGIAMGTAFLAPEAATAAAVLGAAAGFYALGKGAIHLWKDAQTIDNRSGEHTANEVRLAHLAIRNMGAESLDIAAMAAGGGSILRPVFGGYRSMDFGRRISQSMSDAAVPVGEYLAWKETLKLSREVTNWLHPADSARK